MVSRADEIRSMRQKGLDAGDLGARNAVAPHDANATLPISARANCPFCDEEISFKAKKCKHCGETLDAALRRSQEELRAAERNNGCPPAGYTRNKSKIAAFLFAWFLGGIGGHKFYLGRTGQGILYLLFCWTLVPAFLSFFEGIIYLASDEERFWQKYG